MIPFSVLRSARFKISADGIDAAGFLERLVNVGVNDLLQVFLFPLHSPGKDDPRITAVEDELRNQARSSSVFFCVYTSPSWKGYSLKRRNSRNERGNISKSTVLPTRESLNFDFMAKLDDPDTTSFMVLWWSAMSFRKDEGSARY